MTTPSPRGYPRCAWPDFFAKPAARRYPRPHLVWDSSKALARSDHSSSKPKLSSLDQSAKLLASLVRMMEAGERK